MKIFIIEGVVASGKTSFLDAFQHYILDKHPKETKLFFSEHFTQRIFETLEKEKKTKSCIHHFDLLISMLERLHQAHQESHFRENQHLMFVTFERFFLSFLTEGVLNHDIGHHFAQRLMRLGCIQIILQVPEDSLKNRILSTLTHRNDHWKAYIAQLGNINELTDHFLQWQRNLLQQAKSLESTIQTIYYNPLDFNDLQLSEKVYNRFIKEKIDVNSSI